MAKAVKEPKQSLSKAIAPLIRIVNESGDISEIGRGIVELRTLLGEEQRSLTDLFGTRLRKEKAAIPEGLSSLDRLGQDLRVASLTLGDGEARFLVDAYYQHQKNRIRAAHQVRTLEKGGEPNTILQFFQSLSEIQEENLAKALDAYSGAKPIGTWARSIPGIGPIIVAGLVSNIDIHKAPTVGHIWRFAGLDATVKWLQKTRRPWNASLKRLCFIIGDSFTKVSGRPNDIYGRVYRARKNFEIRENDNGTRVEQCRRSLEEKKYGKDTDALAWYSGCYPAGVCGLWNDLELQARKVFPDDSGKRAAWLMKERATFLLSERLDAGAGQPMLPPARIQLRSQRYAVKLFLSHFHHVLYQLTFQAPPPFPYVLSEKAHLVHPELAMHTDFVGPPNWPMTQDFGKDGGGAPEPDLETLERNPDSDDFG